jgi:hypothetical protein
VTSDKNLVAGIAGEFYPQKGAPGQAPGSPVVMPNIATKNHVDVLLSSYTVESLAYTAVKTGLLEMDMTKDAMPTLAKPFFSTSFYTSSAPGLVKKFGPGAEVMLHGYIDKTPKVTFNQKDKIIVQAAADMVLRAKNKAGVFEDAFSMMLSIKCTADVEVVNTTIFGEITSIDTSSKVTHSNVGDVNLKGFDQIIKLAVELGTSGVNMFLAEGFPLPAVKGLTFVNPSVKYGNGYLIVGTNIKLKLP